MHLQIDCEVGGPTAATYPVTLASSAGMRGAIIIREALHAEGKAGSGRWAVGGAGRRLLQARRLRLTVGSYRWNRCSCSRVTQAELQKRAAAMCIGGRSPGDVVQSAGDCQMMGMHIIFPSLQQQLDNSFEGKGNLSSTKL